MRTRFNAVQVLPLLAFFFAAALPLGAQTPPAKPDLPKLTIRAVLSDLEPLEDRDARRAELFYAAVRAEWTRNRWGARAEVRAHDGRFRAYYPGDVWLQEGYAFHTTRLGELRVGKLERQTFPSDDTFGGNLLSLNGVSRNPDWGAGLIGSRSFGYDRLSWSLQYFGQKDGISWERDGQGIESTSAKLRDDIELRASWEVNKGFRTFTPAISFATARIVRQLGPEVRRTDVGIDFTGTLGPIAASVGILSRNGDAAGATSGADAFSTDDGWAGIATFRAEFPTVVYRYTYTEWRHDAAGSTERLHQPAVVWMPVKGIEATIEFEGRRLSTPAGAKVFNALRFGLGLTY